MKSTERPRGFRLVLPVMAVLFSVLLALVAGEYLFGGASGYDSGREWFPGADVSALAFLCALVALWLALRRLHGRGRLSTMLAWQMLAGVLIVVTVGIAIRSGHN